jgi:hypothetical protein
MAQQGCVIFARDLVGRSVRRFVRRVCERDGCDGERGQRDSRSHDHCEQPIEKPSGHPVSVGGIGCGHSHLLERLREPNSGERAGMA